MDSEYSSKSDFSKAEVVKIQVSRCNEIRSKEMKAGYFNYTEDGKKMYNPDTRKEWISSVKALRRLLEPETRKSEKFITSEKRLKQEEKDCFNKYAYTPIRKIWVGEEDGESVARWKKIKGAEAYIPEKDAVLPTNDPKAPSSTGIKEKAGIWNGRVNLYWDGLVKVYDNLFAELNVLIDRNNYFKQKVNYGFDIDEEYEEVKGNEEAEGNED